MNRCPRCNARLVAGIGCLAHGVPSEQPTAEPIEDREAHAPWTDDDWDTVLPLLGQATSLEMAAEIGRTSKAVKHAMSRNGYHIPRVLGRQRAPSPVPENRHRRHWSEEELWALESGELLMLSHTRSRCAIYFAAYRTIGPMLESDGCFSIREAARMYTLSRMRVCRLVKRGDLPAQRLSTRLVRIDPADAERVLAPLAQRHPLPAPDYRGAGSPIHARERR